MAAERPRAGTRRKKSDRNEREKMLDQAIEMTFPASDPIAIGRPTSTEKPARPRSAEAPGGGKRLGIQFTIGLKMGGSAQHRVVDAEDALIAALKVKCEHPEALILYVRRQNRRGDARHPPLESKK